jgi:hypothetical protein
MEGSDSIDSDEIKLTPEEQMAKLHERVKDLEQIVEKFSITGEGIAGNIQDGFSFNPNV